MKELAESTKQYQSREKITEKIQQNENKLQNKLTEQRKHITFLEKKVNNLSKKYDEIQDECVICQEYLFTNRYEQGEACQVSLKGPRGKK